MYDSFLTINIVFVWLNPIYPHGLVAVTECSSIVDFPASLGLV